MTYCGNCQPGLIHLDGTSGIEISIGWVILWSDVGVPNVEKKLEKVGAGWLRKKPQMFDTADRDFLVAFEQQANESFSITPYGRNVPPSKRL